MSTRSFEVREERAYDVVVVGGGTTGIAAAVASARQGARTALVEYCGFLGGNSAAIPGWLGFHNPQGELIVRGIPLEMIEKLREIGEATPFYRDPICGSVVGVNPHAWKIVAIREVLAAGVEVQLHSLVVDVELEEGRERPLVV